jgi:hypothetical protein
MAAVLQVTGDGMCNKPRSFEMTLFAHVPSIARNFVLTGSQRTI